MAGDAELLMVGVLNLIAAGQARYAFAPRVLAVLALSVLAFAALLAALTYIVPFLQSVTGVSGALISVFLLAYGAATAVGTFAGGRTVSLAGPGGQLASALPASAINLGIAFGSYAGGVAIGSFTASAAVVTGLILAALAVPVAWSTSHLRPPVIGAAAPAAAEPAPTRQVA